MNTTGCPANFAQDAVLIKTENAPCSLPIPFFIVICEVYALIHLVVAMKRTRMTMARRRKRNGGGTNMLVATELMGTRSAFVRTVVRNLTLFQSWGSFLTIALVPLVTFVHGSSTIMLGLLFLLFGIESELWLAKLIRLGGRIISKNASSTREDSSGQVGSGGFMAERDRILKRMSTSDAVLRICTCTVRALLVLQFVVLVILNTIFPEDPLWLKIGVGIQGCLIVVSLCATNWQYMRCESAILQVSQVVQDMKIASKRDGDQTKVRTVVQKMREQRLTLLAVAFPGVLVHVLWAAEVLPINYWILIGSEMFDIAVQVTILFSFVRKRGSSSKPTSNASVLEMNSTTIQLNRVPGARDATIDNKHSSKPTPSVTDRNASSFRDSDLKLATRLVEKSADE